jgi:hypothetical protein
MNEQKDWLANLAVGDEVIVSHGGFSSDHPGNLKRVERLTTTLIIIGADRWRRSDGRSFGSYGRGLLLEPTEKRRQALVRHQNLRTVRNARWDKASDELLAQVAALVPRDA